MCTREQLRAEVEELREKLEHIAPQLKRIEDNEQMVKEVHEFLYDGKEDVEQRSVVDDLIMLRQLYNRFKGFSTIIGFIIGVFTIGVPLILGLWKLWTLLATLFKVKGGG